MRGGHSPRYCNRRRIPDEATALRGGKAREEEDPGVRIPAFNPAAPVFFGRKKRGAAQKLFQAGGKENE